jgi:hypothetical protein
VFLQFIARGMLVIVPLTIGAARIYATPSAAAQEMSRCLGVMRVAAARRGARTDQQGPVSSIAGGLNRTIA